MAYPYYPYSPNYFQTPAPDQLAQLRQNFQPQTPAIVWVQNEAEAMNYLVAPNSAVTLWDSNSPVVYLKQTDASGKPSMKTYDLVERTQKPVQQSVEYATKEELNALAAKIESLTAKPIKKTTKEDAE